MLEALLPLLMRFHSMLSLCVCIFHGENWRRLRHPAQRGELSIIDSTDGDYLDQMSSLTCLFILKLLLNDIFDFSYEVDILVLDRA